MKRYPPAIKVFAKMQTKTQMCLSFVNWIEYAHVTTQRIASKVIEIKISVGRLIWP